jgi:hypothetical protein
MERAEEISNGLGKTVIFSIFLFNHKQNPTLYCLALDLLFAA